MFTRPPKEGTQTLSEISTEEPRLRRSNGLGLTRWVPRVRVLVVALAALTAAVVASLPQAAWAQAVDCGESDPWDDTGSNNGDYCVLWPWDLFGGGGADGVYAPTGPNLDGTIKGKNLAKSSSVRHKPDPFKTRPVDTAPSNTGEFGALEVFLDDWTGSKMGSLVGEFFVDKELQARVESGAPYRPMAPRVGSGVSGAPTTKVPAGTGAEIPADHNRKDGETVSDPVNPANGDFYMLRTDLELPAKGVSIVLQRVYHSRTDYDGPLGHGWTHSFDQRLVPGTGSCVDELRYHAGLGSVLTFEKVAETSLAVSYEATGVPTRVRLVGLKAGSTLTWRVEEPDGRVKIFNSRGLLQRVQDATGFGLDVFWEPAPGAAEDRVKSIVDASARHVDFIYNSSGRIDHVVDSATGLEARYTYDRGELTQVTDAKGRREYYEYEYLPLVPVRPREGVSVPEGYLRASCELLCAPSSTSCRSAGICDDAQAQGNALCSTGTNECVQQCPALCADAIGTKPSEAPEDIRAACIDTPIAGCHDRCETFCQQDPSTTTTFYEDACQAAWDFSSDPLSGFSKPHYGCRDYCHPDNNPASPENTCDTNCEEAFLDTCPGAMDQNCPAACEEQCLGLCQKQGRSECVDACQEGTEAIVGCAQREDACRALNWPHMCETSCVSACIDQGRVSESLGSSGAVFGYPEDLHHNMVRVRDGDGRLYLENTYGDDPSLPSFDAVKTQKIGAFTTTFYYRDLDAEFEGAVPVPTEGPATLAKGLATYESAELCPGFCLLHPFHSDANEFVPWGNQLAVVKAGASLGGLPGVKGATTEITPLVLTFRKASNGYTYTRSITGAEGIPAGFWFQLNTSEGVATFTLDTASADQFRVTGTAAVIEAAAKLGDLTLLRDQSGTLRVYRGRPRALLHLSAGTCSAPFQATRNEASQIVLDPPTACSADLAIAPLATVIEGGSYASDYAQSGSAAFAELDLFAPTTVVPARHSVTLRSAKATPGRYEMGLGTYDGAAPGSLPRAAFAVAEAPLFRAPSAADAPNVLLTIFHLPENLRPAGLSAFVVDVFDAFKPEPMGPGCMTQITGPPMRGTGPNAPGPKPGRATVVVDPFGATFSFYYDRDGRSIQQVAHDTGAVRATNYNTEGDVVAVEGPLKERVCAYYDNAGNLAETRQYPAPAHLGSPDPIRQRWEWQAHPARLSKVFDPRDPSKVVASYKWDPVGRLTHATDALSRTTTYTPTEWGPARKVVGPDGSTVEIEHDGVTGLPEESVVDPLGAHIMTVVDLDAAGRPLFQQSAFGATTEYTWSGPLLQSTNVSATGLSQAASFTHNGSGQLATANNGRSVVSKTYDLMGHLERLTTQALTGSLADITTCRKNGPDGRLLEIVLPEGERERYTYDGEGRLLSVVRGKWARDPAGTWDDLCPEALPQPGELASGETERLWYDLAGRVTSVRELPGAFTQYTYDGFGRLIVQTDPIGTQTRTGYDAAGLPTWTATYANVAGVPAYRAPLQGDAGLLTAADFTYDAKGRIKTVERWHFNQNGAPVGDGRSVTTWGYDDLARKVSVIDDIGAITVSTYDKSGRLVHVLHPTQGYEKYEYAADGRTVTKEWTAPTAAGKRVQRTVLTEWGAPERTEEIAPGGVVVPMGAWTYDQAGRPKTVTDVGGAVQAVTAYDAFDRVWTTQSAHASSSQEAVTLGYDRHGRVVSRQSQAQASGAWAATTYKYDAFGRVTEVKRPEDVLETFGYDGVSPLATKKTNARGVLTNMTYHATGALKGVTAGTGTDSTKWVHREFTYDGLGRLIEANDSGAVFFGGGDEVNTSFRWDSLGGKVLESNNLFGATVPIAHQFDGRGLPTQSTLGALTVKRGYDVLGREADIWLGTSSVPEAHFSYAGLGAATSRKLVTGVESFYTYDELGRLSGLQDKKGSVVLGAWTWRLPADGIPRVASLARGSEGPIRSVFQIDAGGRVVAEDHGLTSLGSLSISATTTTTAANAAVAPFHGTGRGVGPGGYGGGAIGTAWRGYALDGRSNWTQRTAGLPALAATTVRNLLDAYTGFGAQVPAYEADGSLKAVGSTESYVYNPFGDVTEIRVGTITRRFIYDALGRRVSETTQTAVTAPGGGTTYSISAPTKYLYDGARRVLRWQPAQSVPEIVVDGQGLDDHIVRVAPDGSRNYYHQGRDHSVYLVTNASGTAAEWYQYTAYGEMVITSPTGTVLGASGINSRFGYQGQPFDSVTGLVDMRARFYRPQWGRFINPDPIGLLGGPNLYAFVGAKPLSARDPFGLKENTAYSDPYEDLYFAPGPIESAHYKAGDDIWNSTNVWEWGSGVGRWAVTAVPASIAWTGRGVLNVPHDVGVAFDDVGRHAAAAARTDNVYKKWDHIRDAIISGTLGVLIAGSVASPTAEAPTAPRATPTRAPAGRGVALSAAELETVTGAGGPRPFPNQMGSLLSSEMEQAARLGVTPIEAGGMGFEALVNAGTVKFAVLEDGSLMVIPKYVDGVEISHAVLSGGRPVLAAGEAEIAGAGGRFFGAEILPHSGHFRPSAESLVIARQAFARVGIAFPY